MIIVAYEGQKSVAAHQKSDANGSIGIGLPMKGFQRRLPHKIRGTGTENAKGLKLYSIPT